MAKAKPKSEEVEEAAAAAPDDEPENTISADADESGAPSSPAQKTIDDATAFENAKIAENQRRFEQRSKGKTEAEIKAKS